MKISAVVNTLNEEKNIERCLKTLSWVDEIVVCDDGSVDKTLDIAKKYDAKIFHHRLAGYVEPARNFGIDKTQGSWILVVDCDEEIPQKLAKKLQDISKSKENIECVAIPRKNFIFGKWIKYSGWWPDYQIRFFKKGKVFWTDKIHQDPKTEGVGCSLLPQDEFAIIHHNYQTVGQFIERMNRYTNIEARQLISEGYRFNWLDLFKKPDQEFFNRFFAQKGYKDGLHGLVLSSLQSFSFFLTYLKVWEIEGSKEQDVDLKELKKQAFSNLREFKFWIFDALEKSEKGARKFIYKFLQKI